MTRRDRISPTRVASLLGVHVNTVYSWCQKAVEGGPSKLQDVKQNKMTGYYWVASDEVDRLKDK